MATLKNTTFAAGSTYRFQSGSTGQRPAATTGTMYLNTDTNLVETYNGSAWVNTQQTEIQRGITLAYETPISTTFTVPAGVESIEVLLVAGGGSGGSGTAGGGGAGGIVYMTNYPVVGGTSYPITVGAGGQPTTPGGGFGYNGSNSSFNDLVAIGGGGGGSGHPATRPGDATTGGSGGGGAWYPTRQSAGAAATQPLQNSFSGQYGYGTPGTPGSGNVGGGGGALSRGGSSARYPIDGNDGGAGRTDYITGVGVIRGGGGGGQANSPSTGKGGPGGGGFANGPAQASPGGWAQGAGGGGGWDYGGGGGGGGGPGVVIIRY